MQLHVRVGIGYSQLSFKYQQLPREPAQLVHAALCHRSFAVGDIKPTRETHDHHRGGAHRHPVAPYKFSRPIPEVGRAGPHRPRFEKGLEIVGKLLDGHVALLRLFAQNEVEIRGQIGIQAAGRGGIGGADGGFDGFRRALGKGMWRLPGQEPIEDGAQRIDVGCGTLGRAADLFGAGIVP